MKQRVARMLKAVLRVIGHVLQLALFFAVLAMSWTGATYLTEALYVYTGRPSWDYFADLFNVILGFVFCILFFMVMGLFFRRKEMILLTTIIDAIRRIAKGDFSVKLEYPNRRGDFNKQIVDSINEMAGALGQMEMMRQDFISNVSHEIQSPLTSIGGFARALRNPALPAEQREHYLDIIESESRRLSQMSDNLLKLSSLETDRASMDTRRIRLDRQLKSVILATEPQWLGKGIQVTLEADETEVEAVEDLLGQVWMNLLHNSIKFTPAGGEIAFKLSAGKDFATVTVADTGIGIGQQDLLHIFERFYKADKSRNRAVGGSGLGLSIVKKIAEIHRGEISVHSVPGQGTRFTVRIPYNWK
ncbi:HAMP domain-containing sensor histidine kinase [Paenibacillus sp. M1]|uniref:histidine kinase n=1 Tax=Paenibacillus haidiansis TaxID=1574488 RepID=A0ABU7VS56_9BACL